MNSPFLSLLNESVNPLGHTGTKPKTMFAWEPAPPLWRALMGAITEPVIVADRAGEILWANDPFLKQTGYTLEEIHGNTPRILKSGRQGPKFYEKLWATITAGQVWRGEMVNLCKDGSLSHVETTITPVRNDEGEVCAFVATQQDLTSVRRAGDRIRAETDLLELTRDGISVRDLTDRILYWNKGAEETFGWTAAEVIGKRPGVDAAAPSGLRLGALLAHILEHGRWSGEMERTRKDGSKVVLQSRCTLMKDAAGRPEAVLVVDTDITQQKRIEGQFLEAQKMEAVGQLAGGVAHDFNNILLAAFLHLALIERKSNLDGATRESLKELEQALQRATSLTRQLLLFSRREQRQLRRVDLNRVVEDLMKMLGRLLGEHITIDFHPAGQPAWLDADPGMLDQVVMNLCVNARDAMPKGGQLTIGIVHKVGHGVRPEGQTAGRTADYVCLEVADTGTGIDPETQKRIFEPFFTTKELGKGTGLGLATVYAIVQQHQGWVDVESALGRGTVMRIYLPAGAPAQSLPGRTKHRALPRGTETILLVEDEDALRLMVKKTLQFLGYKVLEARNATDALSVWNEAGKGVDLLLTDLVLPGGMNGLELHATCRELKPGLKAILTSGYSADFSTGRDPGEAVEVHYLPKPYASETLAHTVRECLDKN